MSPSLAVSSESAQRLPNPFLNSVFGSALDQNPADVGEINAAAFEKCRSLIGEVRQQKLTQALLLFGEPGSGKTHLLSRLHESLEKDLSSGQESLFIPIRMVTSGAMLWRFLRRHLAVALLRQRADKTRALARIVLRSREEIAEQDRDLAIVLGNLLAGVHFADSAAWLRGDELPEEAAKALGVSTVYEDEEQEAASRRIVMIICGLGEPAPFVFCFDQLEALQRYRGDAEGFFKVGQVISDLHDSTRNVLIFSCLQTSMTPQLENVVIGADQDRMHRRRAGLLPLTLEQAKKLIDARLDTVPGLRALQPIGEHGMDDLFRQDGLCVARKVIVRCQELFNVWSRQPQATLHTLSEELEEKLQQLQRTPRIEDAEGILRTALPAVLYLRGIKVGAHLGNSSMIAGSKQAIVAAICNQRPGTGLIRRLERAHDDWQASGAPRLMILRDARNGIGAGAKKSREAVERLESAGARIVPVTAQALAVLEAISRLLANARSGDLTYRGDAVPAATVEQWLSNHMPRAVEELLEEVVGEPTAESDELTRMLTDLLAKTKVIALEDAAAQLATTAQEVEECGRRNAALVGFAGGSRRVLFRLVERASSGEQRD